MSTLDGSPKTLEQLFLELKAAGDALEVARTEASTASNRSTDALNVYNGITKQIDAAMRKLREGAPRSTNWADRKEATP